MKYYHNTNIKVIKGYHKGRTGIVRGNFLFWVEILFDDQFMMTNTVLKKNIRLLGERE